MRSSCAKILGQRRKDLREEILRETAASDRSARVVVDTKEASWKCVRCLQCGKSGHRRLECRKQVSAGLMPGSHAGREAREAGPSSNGRRRTKYGRRTGDTSSPMSLELVVVCQRHEELVGPVVAIERLSGALERDGDTLGEGRAIP